MPIRFDWDGHVHSGFCPHGVGAPTRAFIERAIQLGFKRISIIEHFPLPPDFPEVPTMFPVSMEYGQAEPYVEETNGLRKEYEGEIDVLCGFEWDFLPDFTDWTHEQMDKFGPVTQDGILSIHFLKNSVIDETAEFFMRDILPKVGGTLEGAYEEYYRTLSELVKSDLGEHKPRRIGHLNLIRKFCKLHPYENEHREEILEIVRDAAGRNMQLDLNMSGLRRPYCGEPYVPVWLIEMIVSGEIDIECVFGSDAHDPAMVGKGFREAQEIVGG